MLFVLYRGLMSLSGPLLRWHLKRRVKRGKEDPARLGERFGLASLPRPDGKVLWIHAASVGESLSVLPLIEQFLKEYPAWWVVLTTGTVTSAQLMADRLPPRALHQYAPLDQPQAVRAFLYHWQPNCALWVESELWPVMLRETAWHEVPMGLVNGRISARSAANWGAVPSFARAMFHGFRIILAQSEQDAKRFRRLTGIRVYSLGNLKTAAPPLPVDETALTTLQRVAGGRPCWLAASTQPGDEEGVLRVHNTLSKRFPNLLTIILPRHPERGADLEKMLTAAGAQVARRSSGALPRSNITVYLADTLGETGLFYRFCPVVFMGKSLWEQRGGQNPLEPARLGAAVIFGPHMDNFSEIKDRLLKAGAAKQVKSDTQLSEIVSHLLSNPKDQRAMGEQGRRVAEEEDTVLPSILKALAPLFAHFGVVRKPFVYPLWY